MRDKTKSWVFGLLFSAVVIMAFFPAFAASLLTLSAVTIILGFIGTIIKEITLSSMGIKKASDGDLRDEKYRFISQRDKQIVTITNAAIGFIALAIVSYLGFETALYSDIYTIIYAYVIEIQSFFKIVFFMILGTFGTMFIIENNKKDRIRR